MVTKFMDNEVEYEQWCNMHRNGYVFNRAGGSTGNVLHTVDENDITVLVIIWDDYINEALSALKNPSSGLLTENSFYPDSQFENVDGVIVLRHQHHLKQMFYYGQPIIYSPESNQRPNVFKLEDYNITRGAYLNNSHTEKEIESRIIKELDLYNFTDDFWMFTGEYQPTDLIDWNIGKGIYGLNFCSGTLRTKILSLFGDPVEHTFVTSKIIADFSVINLKRMIEMEQFEEQVLDSVEQIISRFPFTSYGPKLVWDIKEIHEVNKQLKHRFTTLKSSHLSSPCPCNSDNVYKDCCYKKLNYYVFDTFYNP